MIAADTIYAVADPANIFTRKLAYHIKRWPDSQRDLADRVGVSPQVLSNYLRGALPKPEKIYKLSELLELPLEWLLDDAEDSMDPPGGPGRRDLSEVPRGLLIEELNRRDLQAAKALGRLIDRAESLPWERAAAWLLRKQHVEKVPAEYAPVVENFKAISESITRNHHLLGRSGSASSLEDELGLGSLIANQLEGRVRSVWRDRPGVIAISHWASYFDDDYRQKELGKFDPDSTFWNDRRAWLLAMVVTHESIADDPLYEPMRERLRTMNYIDADDQPRDFGKSAEPLGEFDLGKES